MNTNFSIPILYEDDQVVVVYKPSGLLVHEDGRDVEPTLVDWFEERCPEAIGVGESQQTLKGIVLKRSGVVHRLDKETSGVMILVKTPDAFEHCKHQFKQRLVHKEYRAFVYGAIREQWGTIDKPIGRSAKDFRLRSAMRGARGTMRESLTHYERIGYGPYQGELFTYVKLIPKTGRTHQLRAHLRSIERPIVGDQLYAEAYMARSNNLELKRLALHAHVLEIALPGGVQERFIASVPQEFEEAAERIAEE